MRLFLAGNFPQMSDPEREKFMMNNVLSEYDSYDRLVSFYYEKGARNVIGVVKNADKDECKD